MTATIEDFQPLFKHIEQRISLTADEKALIGQAFKIKKVKKKHFLLQSGDVCQYQYFVIKGCLRSFIASDNGKEYVFQFAIEDWWIGDMASYITNTEAILYIEALEDCVLAMVDSPTMDKLYAQLPKMEKYFRKMLENAFVAMQQRILGDHSLPAKERYLHFIEKYPQFEQRLPQVQVASYLGITPEFLSQIRREIAGK
jgi:CRP-like cAMP-binding protein